MTTKTLTIADALKRSLPTPDNGKTAIELSAAATSAGFSGHAFVIANIGFLLPAASVEEVVSDLRYCELPHAVRWFWGITNVRGNLLPVFDFSDLFGFGQSDRKDSSVVILRTGDEVFGIVVADVPARVDLESTHQLGRIPPLPTALQNYVRKSYSKDGHIWIDWHVEDFMQSIAA